MFRISSSYRFFLIAASLTLALLLTLVAGVQGQAEGAQRADALWTPFLDIAPSQDGAALYVSAGNGVDIGGNVQLYLPTHDKDSWTMTFTPTTGVYVATVTGFTPGMDEEAPLRITSAAGYATDMTELRRVHWPAGATGVMQSSDGWLELSVMDPTTLPQEVYVVIAPSFGLPGPIPSAYQLLGSVYNVRASGARDETNSPMLLRMHYAAEMLHGLDPHTLAIFFWDAAERRWRNLGGRLFADRGYLALSTKAFGVYALMATDTWQDTFDDASGLDFQAGFANLTWGGSGADQALALARTPGSGEGSSVPIDLPAGMMWDEVNFHFASDPPTSTLQVDVLGNEGDILLAHVSSGASLAGLDSWDHGPLRLRVRMTSTAEGASPLLWSWSVTWRQQPRVYLPWMGF